MERWQMKYIIEEKRAKFIEKISVDNSQKIYEIILYLIKNN